MTKTELMNTVATALKQYESDNDEIVGGAILFEVPSPPTGKGAWDGYQFDGERFHNTQGVEIRVFQK